MSKEQLKLLLTPEELALALSISRAKAYQLIASGQIPSVRIGRSVRVPLAALQNWIEQQQCERTVNQ